MNITSRNNQLILTDIVLLKKYQLSQLEYYGYSIGDDMASKQTTSIYTELTKLLAYLKDEEISFQLESETQAIYDALITTKEKNEKLFELAKQIKSGAIELPEYRSFIDFINALPRNLKQHQIKAAFHLYSLQNGANFSVPGSGKTSVVLAVYEKLRKENKCNTLFVIGPPSCFQPWKNEFNDTLGRKPESIILAGGFRENRLSEYYKSIGSTYELYLTTFQTAQKDYEYIIKFLSQNLLQALVVIDEAHYMKQVGGSWASALLEISKHATYRCILTGTPIPKGYKDIFNLFDFLWNNSNPLTEAEKVKILNFEKSKKVENAKQLLQEKIGPLFYRVRKQDLGLKDPVFHPPIQLKMNYNENEIYKYTKSRILELSESDYLKNEELLHKLWRGRIIRLRQAVSYPGLLTSIITDYDEKVITDSSLKDIISSYDKIELPAKLQALNELVLRLNKKKQKVLIWSNFVGTLRLIKNHFLKQQFHCELIYGKTPIRKEDAVEIQEEKTREDIRDEFMDPGSGLDILIANPAACAESISLHKSCFHAIYYDLSYNCAQYIQSLDRIHRVGGSENNVANYYFLQYENSLDQDIKKNLEAKAQKMYDLIEQDYAIYDLDLYSDSLEDDIAAYKRLFVNNKKEN